MQLSLRDYQRICSPGVAFAGKLRQELFKSQAVSESNGGTNASGEVSVRPGSFHSLWVENTNVSNLPGRKGAVNLVQITALVVVVC